jgi:hypothetical protein
MLTGPEIVERILDIHPAVEAVSLETKLAGDNWDTGVSWKAVRTPANAEAMLAANIVVTSEHRMFQLLRQTQATLPRQQYRLTDAGGVVWTVEHVTAKVTDYVFDCLCLRSR